MSEMKENVSGMEEETEYGETAESESNLVNVDTDEIKAFVDNMVEFIGEFWEDIAQFYEDVEIYDCESDGIPEVSCDDYENREYDYDTKAQAKLACREELQSAIDDIMSLYQISEDGILESCGEIVSCTEAAVEDFMEKFLSSFDDYMSLECSEGTAEYVRGWKNGLFGSKDLRERFSKLGLQKQFIDLMEEEFCLSMSAKDYLGECDYDRDEDGCYCFELDEALDSINADAAGFVEDAEESVPDVTIELCASVVSQFCKGLWQDLSALAPGRAQPVFGISDANLQMAISDALGR